MDIVITFFILFTGILCYNNGLQVTGSFIVATLRLVLYKAVTMLGSMLINTQVSMTHNAWKLWIDHIMKHKQTFALKKAAMMHDNGTMGSCTSKFMFSPKDIQVCILEIFKKHALYL